MKKISTNAQLNAAIRKVVDYNWNAERKDFEENPLDGDAHIFTVLQALDEWEAA